MPYWTPTGRGHCLKKKEGGGDPQPSLHRNGSADQETWTGGRAVPSAALRSVPGCSGRGECILLGAHHMPQRQRKVLGGQKNLFGYRLL